MDSKACKRDEFRCAMNAECIPKSWVCDEEIDCPGGSDEKHCAGKPFSFKLSYMFIYALTGFITLFLT